MTLMALCSQYVLNLLLALSWSWLATGYRSASISSVHVSSRPPDVLLAATQ
uniref:Uncharacterized protein n=1 Tax=Phakopsora pachyrhizi TaxID=170000 RepID=A0A0S1MIL8_PHAPC